MSNRVRNEAPRSLRLLLLARIGLAFLLPLLGLGGVVAWLHVRHAEMALQALAQRDARHALHRVDEALAGALARLRRLAAAPDPDAAAAALRGESGLHVSRHGFDGARLADTRPPDRALPDEAIAAAAEVAAGARLVSPLVADPASGGHALLLAVAAGGADGFLALAVPAERLRAALLGEDPAGFGPDYGPALADADGRIVARWRDHDALVGQEMPGAAHAVLRASPDGLWHGRNLTGQPVVVAHAVSAFSGLAVGVGITASALEAPRRHSALALLPAAVGLLALGGLATALVARRIADPVARLGEAARAIGDGRAPPPLDTPIAEINAAAAAMAEAAARRRAAEDARELMVRELHHRVKNLLATAQSLATLSARSTADPGSFAAQFGARLRALARTHSLLIEEPGGALHLGLLLRETLAPYGGVGGDGWRITLQGPALPLPGDVAVPLGMVLHELATNAAKHGALSMAEGRLAVAWRVEGDAPSMLVLDWTETGGPRVAGPPARLGFGSQLLRRALSGPARGEITKDWRPEGIRARIVLPLRTTPAEPAAA